MKLIHKNFEHDSSKELNNFPENSPKNRENHSSPDGSPPPKNSKTSNGFRPVTPTGKKSQKSNSGVTRQHPAPGKGKIDPTVSLLEAQDEILPGPSVTRSSTSYSINGKQIKPKTLRSKNSNSDSKNKRPKFWLWGLLALVLLLVFAGSYFYFRATSFVNDTLGGYNAPSLLTATVQVPPTNSPIPPVENPVQNPVVAPAPLPTATLQPLPTATVGNVPAIVSKIRRGERVSVLVMGYGGVGHDGAFLTDTLMQLVYDPSHKAVSMVNIPRDLFAFVPYGGPKVGFWSKINSAFAFVMEGSNPSQLSSRYRYTSDTNKIDAAANLTKDTVEQVTGIPVDYWVAFNFNGFRRFIEAIGGVDIMIDTTFDDYDYPTNDNPDIDASVMHIHFEAGYNHLNGERAIQYARSRKSAQDGSDFGRSRRQMKLVQAVKEKITRPDILLKTLDIMDALQGNIRTNLTFDEARGLVEYFKGSEGMAKTNNLLFVSNLLTVNFLTDLTSPTEGYILLPLAGQGNYKDIQDWLQKGLLAPEIRYENLKVQVQNGSGVWKPATTTTTNLDTKGINTLDPIWAAPTPLTTILDYSEGKAKFTLQAIIDLFPTAIIKPVHKTSLSEEGPDLVVLLGQDTNQSSSKPVTPSFALPTSQAVTTAPVYKEAPIISATPKSLPPTTAAASRTEVSSAQTPTRSSANISSNKVIPAATQTPVGTKTVKQSLYSDSILTPRAGS